MTVAVGKATVPSGRAGLTAVSHTVHLWPGSLIRFPGGRLRLRSLGVAEDDLKCALELCRRAELDDLGAGM